jgi:metallophosphoesterase (TIGR00282 family)
MDYHQHRGCKDPPMKILFLGDVVGRSGRKAVARHLPGLIARHGFDFVIVNGENAAGGFGITEEIFDGLIDAGADCVTTGNHAWNQKEALVFAARQERFIRPANYPDGTPGRGANIFTAKNGARVLVMQVMGQLFMPALDDPFAAAARALAASPLGEACDAIIVDMHAEATSEKQVMAAFLDSKVSLVVGTHTHVPTADHRILPGGTAFMTNAGICSDYDSIIGMDKDEPLRRATLKIPSSHLEPAKGPGTVSGVAIETDDATGLAKSISAVRIGPGLTPAEPDF